MGRTKGSKNVPEWQQGIIVAAYLQGKSAQEACKPFGYAHTVCLTALKKRGLSARSKNRWGEFSDEIAALYQSGKSMEKVANMVGCSVSTCQKSLRLSKIQIRENHPIPPSQRKYKVNHDYFESVDSEEKAYWLGFIAADGCVYENKLILSLSARDAEHLPKLVMCLESDYPVRIRTCRGYGNSTMALLNIASPKIVSDLGKLGVLPRKSFVAEAWQGPEHLMRHYWRGVFDGDGWIYSHHRKTCIAWTLGICGSRPMMESFLSYAKSICGTKSNLQPNHSIWNVIICGAGMTQMMCRELYDNAQIYLERKKILADALCAYRVGDLRGEIGRV